MARTTGSHSGITGPKIRAVATHLFARHGFAAVSMRQIAAEVGVQAGAIYNYTADKQSLLFDLMQEHMDLLLERFEDDPACPPLQRLQHFVRFHIRFNQERPDAVFIAYMELRNLSPENFARIEALRGAYETRLEDIIRAGVTQKVFEVADTKIATLAVIAMLTGVTTWFRPDGRLALSDVEDHYWQLVHRALGVPETPA